MRANQIVIPVAPRMLITRNAASGTERHVIATPSSVDELAMMLARRDATLASVVRIEGVSPDENGKWPALDYTSVNQSGESIHRHYNDH